MGDIIKYYEGEIYIELIMVIIIINIYINIMCVFCKLRDW